MLAKRLDKAGCMQVREAVDGDTARSGEVLVAPGDFQMRVVRAGSSGLLVRLGQRERVNGCRPAADVQFKIGADVTLPPEAPADAVRSRLAA